MGNEDEKEVPVNPETPEGGESESTQIGENITTLSDSVGARIEEAGYNRTNIRRVEYQNGVTVFKWVSTKVNDGGDTEYYFSKGHDAPGNRAFAPENKLVVDHILVGTERQVAENICYNPRVSRGDWTAETLVRKATEEIDAGKIWKKFPVDKLNKLEDAMDEILETISPSRRPSFIKGISALSDLYSTPEELRSVADVMIHFVKDDLSSRKYPEVFWEKLVFLSPYVRTLEELKEYGRMIIENDVWRIGTESFLRKRLGWKRIRNKLFGKKRK